MGARAYWYVVLCTGRVQGIFGSALYADACSLANRVEAETGSPSRVSKSWRRPEIGDVVLGQDVLGQDLYASFHKLSEGAQADVLRSEDAMTGSDNERAAARRRAAWITGWCRWVGFADRQAHSGASRCWYAGWDAAARANEMGGNRPTRAEAEGEWAHRAWYAREIREARARAQADSAPACGCPSFVGEKIMAHGQGCPLHVSQAVSP